MKQLLQFSPEFDPAGKTLNFNSLSGFDITRLYAVINVTRNQPIYVAGAPGLGITNNIDGNLTLIHDTTTYSSNDILNIYYDGEPGVESNAAAEKNGNLEKLVYLMQGILIEMKVNNHLLQGLHNFTAVSSYDDLEEIRNMVTDPDHRETKFSIVS